MAIPNHERQNHDRNDPLIEDNLAIVERSDEVVRSMASEHSYLIACPSFKWER